MTSGNIYFFNRLDENLKEYSSRSGKKIEQSEHVELHTKLEKLLVGKDYDAIKEYLKETEKKYESIDFSDLFDYINVKSSSIMVEENKRNIKHRDGFIHGFLSEMRSNYKEIRVINGSMSYGECKSYIRYAIELFYNQSTDKIFENKIIYPFFVSENFKLTGTVILKRSINPEIVTLIAVKPLPDGTLSINFFGDKMKFTADHQFKHYFHVYRFEGDDKKSYMLFSKDEIPTQHCEVKGMLVDIEDRMALGNDSKINTNLNTIFVTSCTPDIQTITPEKFSERTKDWDHEKIAEIILKELRHPVEFEKLLFAWLFSSKRNGYPMHLFWMAQPGTGKSYFLDSLIKLFGEGEVADGSNTPLKFFIPSFGGHHPEPGYIVRRNRIGAIDELLRALTRSHADVTDQLGYFTSLLEHKSRPIGSGKHAGSVPIKASCKMIFATNPKSGGDGVYNLVSGEDKAFFSRVLIYHQTKYHVQFIRARREVLMSMKEEDIVPKYNKEFLEIYDYLQSIQIELPAEEIQRVFEAIRLTVPQDMLDIFDARYDHHFFCLVDGISKYNSIIEKRGSLCYKPNDLVEAEDILRFCLESWSQDLELQPFQMTNKQRHLPLPARQVYEFILKNAGVTAYKIRKETGIDAYKWIPLLKNWKLIREDITKDGDSTITNYYGYTS